MATLLGAEARPLRGWQQAAALLDWGFSQPRDASVGNLISAQEAARVSAASPPAGAPPAARPQARGGGPAGAPAGSGGRTGAWAPGTAAGLAIAAAVAAVALLLLAVVYRGRRVGNRRAR